MTIETVVALVSLATTLLLAGRVVFRTEADVAALERRANAFDGSLERLRLVESRTDALVERCENMRRDIEKKASLDIVDGVRKSVDDLATLMKANFAHLEQLIKRERNE